MVYGAGAPGGAGPLTALAAAQPVVFGRDPEPGETRLDGDAWASRRHARATLDVDSGHVVVEDLGSRNGTWVDGRRIAGPTALEPGQVLPVGATLFVVGQAPAAQVAATPDAVAAGHGFVALGPASLALWRRLVTIAKTDEPALVTGEIGTGKTLIARLIHEGSARAAGPFVPHNASAIPLHLEEATLFGVVKGFIPGVNAQKGLLAQAAGGTLFLDELADLTAPAQAKLLDALDPSRPSFLPVGGAERQPTRCRLVVAVQHDLFDLVESGRVRHDLASRIAVARLDVPPLRGRRDDALLLFAEALRRYAGGRELGSAVPEVEIAEALVLAPWTENVRGLESLARRVALGEALTVDLVRKHAERGGTQRAVRPSEPGPASASAPPAPPVATAPRAGPPLWPPTSEDLLRELALHGFQVTVVADHYGRTRETLGRFLTKLFGPGGKPTVQRAYRVLEASGRAPAADELERVFELFCAPRLDPADDERRRRWARTGRLDGP
ncbi:MAG: sigma 54-interacting transcriptional regulator [Myxococcota bacterium]